MLWAVPFVTSPLEAVVHQSPPKKTKNAPHIHDRRKCQTDAASGAPACWS